MWVKYKTLIKTAGSFGKNNKRLTFTSVFASIGCLLIFITNAATFSIGTEPENGSLGGVNQLSDSSASNGMAIQFGATSATWPNPNDYKVCGNTSILNGPTSAQTGWVTVNPGTNLATLTSSSSAGTTFYLTAGTHTLPSGPIKPKTGNTYIGAPGAILDGQYTLNDGGTRSAAFTGGEPINNGNPNVTIKYLTITRFGAENGLLDAMVNSTAINRDQANDWTIMNNTISYNGGSGVVVSNGTKLQNNCIEYNEQMGTATSTSSGNYTQRSNVLIENNEIRNNNRTGSIEGHGCTGCAGGLKIWNSKDVTIRNNNVHDNKGNGIWIDNNNIDVLIDHNVSKDNTKRGIMYEISYSAIIRNNYVTGNYVVGKGGVNNASIYISESGGDEATKSYLGGTFAAEIDVYGNYVGDNWHGITLWESAARYCFTYTQAGPSNHNDTKWCPPILQGKNDTDLSTGRARCVNDFAGNADICRWMTKNVKVHNNKFEMTSTAASWCTVTNTGCANMAITASTDAPVGTPYAGTVVRDNITKNQNNKFYNNEYVGTWNFYIPNTIVSRSVWQNTWGQDDGSIFN